MIFIIDGGAGTPKIFLRGGGAKILGPPLGTDPTKGARGRLWDKKKGKTSSN